MGFQKLDERTIVSDSYSPYGELPQLPDRPDKTLEGRARERKADRITMTDVQRLMGGWSIDDLDSAIASRGFPRPIGFREGAWPLRRREAVYSFQQIQTWFERERAFQATLPKELNRE